MGWMFIVIAFVIIMAAGGSPDAEVDEMGGCVIGGFGLALFCLGLYMIFQA